MTLPFAGFAAIRLARVSPWMSVVSPAFPFQVWPPRSGSATV